MRKLIVLPLLAAGTFAGTMPVVTTSAKSAKSPKAPIVTPKSAIPSPDLYQWFVGGTAGYLMDNECEFYSGHIGVDLPYQVNGWDTATYLEIGYWGCEETVFSRKKECDWDKKYDSKYSDDEYCDYLVGGAVSYDLDVIPITLNYKLERPVGNGVHFYMGAGAGIALFDLSNSLGQSDDETSFFAQGFAGLLYHASEQVEFYAGARVIYFDEPTFELGGTSVEPGLEEVDVIAEGGVRVNF